MPRVAPPTRLHSGLVNSGIISLRQVKSQGWLQPRLPRATVLSGSVHGWRGGGEGGKFLGKHWSQETYNWPLPFSQRAEVEREGQAALLS